MIYTYLVSSVSCKTILGTTQEQEKLNCWFDYLLRSSTWILTDGMAIIRPIPFTTAAFAILSDSMESSLPFTQRPEQFN